MNEIPLCTVSNCSATLSAHYRDGTKLCLSHDWKKCPYSLLEGYLVLYDTHDSPSDMIVLCKCPRESKYVIYTTGAE